MKTSSLGIVFSILLFFPPRIFTQDVTGLWKGTLFNDTTQQSYYYELAISEKSGKLSGYSYTIFDIEGKEEVGVKKVRIKREGTKLLIRDEKLIYNNYTEPAPKGRYQASKIYVQEEDCMMVLAGVWKANATWKYLPFSGSLKLSHKPDLSQAKLVMKLDEMDLIKDLSFNQPEQKKQLAIMVEQARSRQDSAALVQAEKIKDSLAQENPDQLAVNNPGALAVTISHAEKIKNRKTGNTQTVTHQSDSLILTLYDNGEVDGDIVSVLMNDTLIYVNEKLGTKANSKTIYLNSDMGDSVVLIMYAENLGSIPPNTGLLVVHDANEVHELRFSADLETNAQIILKRKKKK